MVQDAIADGIDLVAFSADKLLGGPQAGIIVGNAALIGRLRSNPLIRALRVDKVTLAALAETLRLYVGEGWQRIPLFRMLGATLQELQARADRYCRQVVGSSAVDTQAYVGAGALPDSSITSIAIRLPVQDSVNATASRLRALNPPIVSRIEKDSLLLDLRTIFPEQDEGVIAALRAI